MSDDISVGDLVRLKGDSRRVDRWESIYTQPKSGGGTIAVNGRHDAIVIEMVRMKSPIRTLVKLLFPTGIGWINVVCLEKVK